MLNSSSPSPKDVVISSIVVCALWVVAGAITAMLPMRRQYAPGLTLLIAAPFLIFWLGYDYGWVFAFLGMAAFVSMFRNPLRHIYRLAKGEKPELPR